jgi:hypothetical protein
MPLAEAMSSAQENLSRISEQLGRLVARRA